LVVVAGLAIGWLPIAALDGAIPKTAIPYNDAALRAAIADGMSRAGAASVHADDGPDARP
jgi:hypothetical protein